MSSLAGDLLIILLLFAGVGFGGISLMGLLIFPDIRSRMYTALRAGLICSMVISGSALVYALVMLTDTGGEQYTTLLFHTIFFTAIMALGIMVINRQLLEKTRALVYCGQTPPEKPEEK